MLGPCWQAVAFLQHAHNVECPSWLGTWQGLGGGALDSDRCLACTARAPACQKGRVDAVWGRIACLAAGLVSATDAGPPAGWEDVLPDALLAMARGQSRYRPSPGRVWSASQDRDTDHDWADEMVKTDE